MSDNKTQLEMLFALAKEAEFYSKAECELLRSVTVTPITKVSRSMSSSSQIIGENVSFQDKLQTSYGL